MDIQKQVIFMVAEHLSLKPEDIRPESGIIKDLKADSLDVVEMIMSFEEKFGISIPDQEAEKMTDIKSIVSWIEKKKKSSSKSRP